MPNALPPAVLVIGGFIVALLLLMMCYRLILRFFGVVIIPQDSIGIVNKKFVLIGSHKTLPDGQIIALNGEAGYQGDTLAPGIHFLLWPWQYVGGKRLMVDG